MSAVEVAIFIELLFFSRLARARRVAISSLWCLMVYVVVSYSRLVNVCFSASAHSRALLSEPSGSRSTRSSEPKRRMRKTLVLSSSPRRDGNSYRMAAAALEGARAAGDEAELLYVDDYVERFLRDCRQCRGEDHQCTLDDRFGELFLGQTRCYARAGNSLANKSILEHTCPLVPVLKA